MSTAKNANTFTVLISLEAHQIAQSFREKHSNSIKRKQVYLNTLAVYAVNKYLQILGVNANLEASFSWDPIMQTLLDTGTLQIGTQGKLECRPVLPDSDSFYIPFETLTNRLGYVAVKLNKDLSLATLVGFLKKITQTEVLLNDLDPIDSVLDVIDLPIASPIGNPVIHLRKWFNHIFDIGWLEAQEFFLNSPLTLSPLFRGNSDERFMTTVPPDGVIGVKVLEYSGKSMALCVGLSPRSDEIDEVDISIELYPVNGDLDLPESVVLTLLDSTGKRIIESQPFHNIEYQFSGEIGERFSIQISFQGQDEFGFLETFLI